MFWIAANWQTLGPFGRFALLEGFVLALFAGALWRPAARAPLGLLALLAIGGLSAYFGQTYRTGADPWRRRSAPPGGDPLGRRGGPMCSMDGWRHRQ